MISKNGTIKNGLHRVVITGIGAVTSIGKGKEAFWNGLIAGRSGVSRITAFDTSEFRTSIGGEIKDFDPLQFIHADNLARYGRASQLGIAATKLAIEDAQLGDHDLMNRSLGVIVGTTNGESKVMESINDRWVNQGWDQIDEMNILQYPGNLIALNIAKELEMEADCVVIPTACAAGNYAIGYGYDQIRTGKRELVFAGGCDAFSRSGFTGFNSLFALAPEKCQPFDKNRKGIVVGEGAGIVVLESLEHALQRGAINYAEILGYALSCDASHMTIPSADGVLAVMEKALKESAVDKTRVSYISAHGTGTTMNDRVESSAIRRVFGERAQKIPVSSIKSMLGHTMGAASALEAIACAMAIYDSKIPPTINHETDDEECKIDCVPNRMRELDVDVALNNSFAFGGNNACLVLGKCPVGVI
ncbi:MAG: beta-ketoacyl-[acyl-carrier-protein] synthase family protein [Candidatus Omnitrophota bacterium]